MTASPPSLEAPALTDVLEARRRIAPYLPRTPLRHYPNLSRLVGAEVWVEAADLARAEAILNHHRDRPEVPAQPKEIP